MRNLSPTLKALLKSDEVSMCYLVKIEHPDGTIYDTTAVTPIIYNSDIYSPNGNLLSVEPPKLSETVDREPYKIIYADAEHEKFNQLEGSWTGILVTVFACFFNTTGEIVGDIPPNEPLVNDVLIAYRGFVDSQSYTIDPDSGTVIALIECASPMASLGLIKSFYTSDESMRQIDPTDTSFSEIHTGAQEAAILWGKA